MAVGQRGQGPPIGGVEGDGLAGLVEDVLDHEGVDVDER